MYLRKEVIMNRCIGCGSKLTNEDENQICRRCFRLKNYGEYKIVEKDNEEFMAIIDDIDKESLVLYVTSLFNLNMDFINKFKNVILVLTKKDILPKSVKDEKIIEYIKKYDINVLDIEVISSIKNYRLDNLMNKIYKYKTTNNVYVVGNTNSGKSTLINKIIKNYSNKDIDITTSLFPSTTLDKIEININDDLNIIDTPGIVDYTSFIHGIDFKLLKQITPKKEIKPRVYQIKDMGCLLIDDLVRIEYDTKVDNSMVIYIANNINISFAGKSNDKLKDLEYQKFNLDNGKDLVIPDLCFIKFRNKVDVRVYIKDNVVVKMRDNLI